MGLKTIEYLTDPDLWRMYWPSIATGCAIAALCAPLSVLVVLKRLAFIGQGISHAAFGGWGVASILASAGAANGVLSLSPELTGDPMFQLGIVYAFCLGASLVVGWLGGSGRSGRRRVVEPDTAIGIVLVASMALGAVLNRMARNPKSWESFLFGSVIECREADAVLAVGAAVVVIGVLWLMRRSLAFWAFDEPAAAAFGVRVRAKGAVLMALLALATVVSMRLVGVVPATALLVLPGATGLAVSRRWRGAHSAALGAAVLGVLGGLVVSFELDLLPGSSIVLVLTLLFALAPLVGRIGSRRAA